MAYWRPERLFEGFTVVIVGGGESFDATQARRIGMARSTGAVRVIAINDAVYPCWYADIAYACDAAWWRVHGPLSGFRGLRVTLEKPVHDGILQLENTGNTGFDPEPGKIRTGGNGGYQMLHLCAHLGASKVILVGLDMHGGHWFGQHPQSLLRSTNHQTLSNRVTRFVEMAPHLAKRGIDVVNVSSRSRLTVFRSGNLDIELRDSESAHAQKAGQA